MKIREYFLSVRTQMEEYSETLKSQLRSAQEEIAQRDIQIEKLKTEGEEKSAEVKELESERQQIKDRTEALELQVRQLQEDYERKDELIIRIPKLDPNIFGKIAMASGNLRILLSKYSQRLFDIQDQSFGLTLIYKTISRLYLQEAKKKEEQEKQLEDKEADSE